jgi:hypothetical protein
MSKLGHRYAYSFTLAAACIAVFSSCDDPSGSDGPRVVARINIVGGQDLSGVVGKELSPALEVQVLDAEGRPISGQIVNFRVVSGGGSVFAGAANTNSSGIAKERWTLGTSTADSQRVEVRAVDPVSGDPIVFGTFRATAIADVPAVVEKVQGDAQTVRVGLAATDSLAVRVKDQYGNPAPGVSVGWVVGSGGGGSVSPASTTTNAAGVAKTQLTAGTTVSSSLAIQASVPTLAAIAFTATSAAAPATQLLLMQPAAGAASGSAFGTQPIVRFIDVHGNTDPTVTAPVSVTVTGSATLTGTTAVTPVNGVATFSAVGLLGTTGNYTLSYSTTLDDQPVTVTQPINLSPGAAAKYVVSTSVGDVTVGEGVNVQAQLTDVSGNALTEPGRTVTWSHTGAGGAFQHATSVTNTAGVAANTFTASQTYTGASAQVSATDNSSLTGSATFGVHRGSASKLAFNAVPTSRGFAVTMPSVSVSITDTYGNVVPDERSMSLTLAGPTTVLQGTASRAAVNGVAVYPDLRIDDSGTGFTLTASAAGLSSATSAAFTVDTIGIIATGFTSAYAGIVKVGNDLYLSGGNAFTVSADGGMPSQMPDGTSTRGYGDMVTDGAELFIVRSFGDHVRASSFMVFPLNGGAAYEISLSRPRLPFGTDLCHANPGDIAVDASYIYVGCAGANQVGNAVPSILRINRADRSLAVVAETSEVAFGFSMTVHNGIVYYTDRPTGTIRAAGSPFVVTGLGNAGWSSDAPGARRLIVADGMLFWAESGDRTVAAGSIRSAPLAGGAAVTRAAGLLPSIRNFRVDAGYLYFVDDFGLRRMSLTNYGVTPVINGLIGDFMIDGETIYWRDAGSASATDRGVRKMRKPAS